jgi:predicted dehydrogenase
MAIVSSEHILSVEESKLVDLVVVGVGDHYKQILSSSIEVLHQQGHVRLIATVDIIPLEQRLGTSSVPHLIRRPNQRLSELLQPFRSTDPIVYLAHSHTCHTPDTLDLTRYGFRVAVEKPYAISLEEVHDLEQSIEKSRVFLPEYYLVMKSAPLLHVLQLVTSDSFLHREAGFLTPGPASSLLKSGGLAEVIGTVRFVYLDILEGEGKTGRFEHRGDEYADRRRGGGIIMDLGVHAFAPIVAIAPMIGDIQPAFRTLESATADDFRKHATSRGIPFSEVPETYSTVTLESNSGVPITIAIAKYTPRDRNQRRLILVGDAGEAMLDMSSCVLYVARGDEKQQIMWQIPKDPNSKYVPVLRSILEAAEGRPQFSFDVNKVCLKSQALTLAWRRKSDLDLPDLPTYATGTEPGEIIKHIRSKRGPYASE